MSCGRARVLETASLGNLFAAEENEGQRGGGISWLGTRGQLMAELGPEPRPLVPSHCSSCFNRDERLRSSWCREPWYSFEFSSEVGAADTLERTERGCTHPQGLAGGMGSPAPGCQGLQLWHVLLQKLLTPAEAASWEGSQQAGLGIVR